MLLADAEAEFIRLCKEISELEKRLKAARNRAEKLAHFIEIAREKEGSGKAEASGGALPGQSTVVRLRKRPRHRG